MKIGYVHSRGFPSVDANVVQVVQMCRAFAEIGHDVTLFIPRSDEYSDDTAALRDSEKIFGGKLPFQIQFVRRVRLFGRLEVLGTVRGTMKALHGKSLDVIYTRNPWSVPFLARKKWPLVFEVHESQLHRRSAFLGAILQGMIVRASKSKNFLKMIAISGALKDVWKKFGVPEAKLVVAHDGVDLKWMAEAPPKEIARTKLNIDSASRAVVYTGALHEDRGIDLIFEAAARLPHLHFFIVGGLEDQVAAWNARKLSRGVSNVSLTGRIPHRDIPTWLSAADILLMMWTWKVPTIRICSPMKLFEYMAANRIIVGPAFPTILEVVEPDREAILFEPDNVDDLVAAIVRAESLPTDSEMPLRARKKVEHDYTWTHRADIIINSLQEKQG